MISLLFFVFLGVQGLSLPKKILYDLEDAGTHFEDFMKTYTKEYASEEEKNRRFEIFKKNLVMYNVKNEGQDLAVFGIDKFADLDVDEFMNMTCIDFKLKGTSPCQKRRVSSVPGDSSAPTEYDWRQYNKVTRVKNQGDCGSCWAFSSTGNIEGQYAIANNELREFSERQLVDCEQSNLVCNPGGSWISNGILYVMEAGGIQSEQDYPYNVENKKTCKFDPSKVQAKVVGCNEYTFESEDDLAKTLSTVGPLAIGVAAGTFHGYRGGIMPFCPQDRVNHAVLLVGYGVEKNVPYWIIKNSWGTTWGEQGYIRVKRNENSCNMMNPQLSQIISAVLG